ncbi:MAG: FumA C-terminus/TtdB family hydratase beta subunit [Planctomycetota bacterium]
MVLTPPFDEETVRSIEAGTEVLLQGTLYAARDEAHRRMVEALERNEALPFDLRGAVLYYVGPTPGAPGRAVGAAGPTTAARMDPYTPLLLEHGLRGMIGKGGRSLEVIHAMHRFGAVYFAATGGAGALLGRCVRSAEVIAYGELGPEAIRRLAVYNFPAIVAIDAAGRSLYR